MSKARSIKTDLEQYLTELDKQYGNNKVSIMTPITATDPVISPLKKPVKELIKDANPELYQTILDKQYGNNANASAVSPNTKTNTEQIAEANPEASSAAKSAYQIQRDTLLAKLDEFGVNHPSEPGTARSIETGEPVKLPLPNPEKETTKEQIEKANQELYARESPESLAGLPEKTEVQEEEQPATTYTDGTTGSEEVASTPAVKSYEAWLADMKRIEEESANRQYQITKDAAQGQYDQTMYGAAVAEQKAINDAQNAYALRRATYGAQGESLGRNGLAMSGYSDYADQAAYAASRGEIAGAGAVRAGTEQQAMSDYRNYLLSAELAKEQAMSGAEYEYAQNMAKLQAERDEQLAQYEAALAEQQAKNFESIYETASEDPNTYSKEQIQAFADAGYISQEQADSIIGSKETYDTSVDEYMASIDNLLDNLTKYGNPTDELVQLESTIEGEYAAGKISEDVYQQLYGKLANRYAANVDDTNYKTMKDTLASLRSEGKLSASGYAEALDQMNKSIEQSLQVDHYTDKEWGMLSAAGSATGSASSGLSLSGSINAKSIGDQLQEFLKTYVGNEHKTVCKYKGDTYVCINGTWKRYSGEKSLLKKESTLDAAVAGNLIKGSGYAGGR